MWRDDIKHYEWFKDGRYHYYLWGLGMPDLVLDKPIDKQHPMYEKIIEAHKYDQ